MKSFFCLRMTTFRFAYLFVSQRNKSEASREKSQEYKPRKDKWEEIFVNSMQLHQVQKHWKKIKESAKKIIMFILESGGVRMARIWTNRKQKKKKKEEKREKQKN